MTIAIPIPIMAMTKRPLTTIIIVLTMASLFFGFVSLFAVF